MSRLRFDWWLVIPSLFLSLLGLVTLNSISPQLAGTQVYFFLLAGVIFLIVSQADFTLLPPFHRLAYIFSLFFLVLPLFFGTVSRGSYRWLQVGRFSLQPSELVKPVLLLVFSSLAASDYARKRLWLVVSAVLPALLIYFQPDLGTTLVLMVGWAAVFLTQVSTRTALLAGLLVAVSLLPGYHFLLQDYQRQRLHTFLSPYQDPLGRGYHVIQSIIAVGSGKFLGRGLGHGTQSQLRFLPEYHTDFIFATIGESLGFIGSIFVLVLFFVLLWRIYRVSQSTLSPAASYFCISTAALLSFQIFINIGMNLGLAPVTGITLPLLSYGGSSLISTALLLGLVNSISIRKHSSSI